jgi:hypothetical protein
VPEVGWSRSVYPVLMPETFGKRQRTNVKQKKAADREERRVARAQRKSDREAGIIEAGPPIQANEPLDLDDDFVVEGAEDEAAEN